MVKIASQPPTGAKPPAAVAPNPAAPAAAAGEEKKKKSKRLKRQDFASWPEYCEHKKQQCLAKAERQMQAADLWEKKKANENLGQEEKKIKRLQKLQGAVGKLAAELKALGISPDAIDALLKGNGGATA